MRRITILIVSLFAAGQIAQAQTVQKDLIGLGMKPEQADYLAGILPAGSVLGNNTTLKARNQANSADIDVLKVDATDDLAIISDASDFIYMLLGGDANRKISFDASSDTVHKITFGDGGTTATQRLVIGASTSDGDDDSDICVTGGGFSASCSESRGAFFYFSGNESSGGDAIISATDDFNIRTGASGVDRFIFNDSGNLVNDATNGGDIIFQKSGTNVVMAAYVPTMAATPVAGTNQLLPGLNVIPTAAANAAAMFAATPSVGAQYRIVNSGPNAVRAKGGGATTINGATAGGYISIASLASVNCMVTSASNINCEQPVIPTPAGP